MDSEVASTHDAAGGYDVGGIGTVVVDQQVVLPQFPDADSKSEAISQRSQVGGPVPTALVLLARFGRRCLFLGKWGDDSAGEFIERDLQQEAICAEPCVRVERGSTGFAHVWVDQSTGSRTIACWRGGLPELEEADVDQRQFARCRVLHLDGWSSRAAIRAAKIVRGHGGHVFLDAGSPKPGIEQLIPLVDSMICPRRFSTQYFRHDDLDRSAAELRRMGVDRVVFTSGTEGCVHYSEDGRRAQRAYDVDAIDSTGAGDVFSGAMIHAHLEKMDVDTSLRFASAVSALKCKQMGNRDALPTLAEAIDLATT